MLRPGAPTDDATLLIRATPASIDEAALDIAEDALESAAVYEVERPAGERVALYGVSVFARPHGTSPTDVLRRFASSPYFLEAAAGAVAVPLRVPRTDQVAVVGEGRGVDRHL